MCKTTYFFSIWTSLKLEGSRTGGRKQRIAGQILTASSPTQVIQHLGLAPVHTCNTSSAVCFEQQTKRGNGEELGDLLHKCTV